MADVRTIVPVDPVSADALAGLASRSDGPCVSILLPTHRAGPETRQDPVRFRNLLDEARCRLADLGTPSRTAEEILARPAGFLDDTEFWRHQADGLAVFAAPGVHEAFRVALDLPETVMVGSTFHVQPLLPLLTGDGRFFVLALSQARVRLFEATRTTISSRDLGPTPTSMAEALRHEESETQLQLRTTGPARAGGGAVFHGHGAGAELDKRALERYFRAVDAGLQSVLGNDTRPLVLACVAYYLPIFRSVTRHPHLLDRCVEGNPDGKKAHDLHEAGWELVAPEFEAARRAALDRFGPAAGTGRTVTTVEEIAAAAAQGRVDTLFVVLGEDTRAREDLERMDRAVLDTLQTGGSVYAVEPSELPDSADEAALLRY